jgi:parallel beta-helix repeat protein
VGVIFIYKNLYKKTLIIGIIVILVGTGFASGLNIKNNKICNFHGNTLYVGGPGEGNYTSIQEAINDANDGDSIYVFNESSPYYENVVVNKSIYFIGENKDTTIIDGSGGENVIYITADFVFLMGFTIKNGGLEFPYAGIQIRSNNNFIYDNNLENNYYGLNMFYSQNNSIIKNNIINNKQCGIYLEESSNNNISENLIDTQTYNGIGLFNSSNENTISKNTILNNKYTGIRIIKSFDNNIFRNLLSKNLVGVRIEFSSNTEILNNNLIKNTDNEAYFIGNILSIYTNIWDGNYWNRQRILPKPIFGYTEIILIFFPWIMLDLHPAKEPNQID